MATHKKIVSNGMAYYVSNEVMADRFKDDVWAFISNSHLARLQVSDFVIDDNGALLKCRYLLEDILDNYIAS